MCQMIKFKINMSQIAFKCITDFIEQKDQSNTIKIHIALKYNKIKNQNKSASSIF